MVYVELWFDAEKDRDWKITLWQIEDYDFDPFTSQFITLNVDTENQHVAREHQLEIVRDLKSQGVKVVANAYIDRSRFIIRPRWMEELLSPIGRIQSGKPSKENSKNLGSNGADVSTNLRKTYTVWIHTQTGAQVHCGHKTDPT